MHNMVVSPRRVATFASVTALATALFSTFPAHAQTHATIGRTLETSVEGSIERPEAREGAPNILVWMLDDTGFGQLGCYGGLVDTPNIDRVARRGLRYSNYHATPICSASRASFLTGRNSHEVHVGGHSAMSIGFPGQDALVPRGAGTIAENLRQSGYLTYAVGKWDHLPPTDASAAGPFTYWPSGQGFDQFYGFLSYDANNFAPLLWDGHSSVALNEDPAYHLSSDMANRAIAEIEARQAKGAKRPPFFMYWATGAVHSPHHAPDEWLEKYRGKFDEGWDVARERILARQKELGLVPANTQLPPRPEGMPAWTDLSETQQRVYARAMEAFAAQLAHADFEFGRMLDALEASGELDNTIVVVTSDNGASGEGAVEGTFSEFMMANGRFASVEQNEMFLDEWGRAGSYPLYPVGWAVAGDTPFRYYKQTAHEGGIRVPLIISWPAGIGDEGGIRDQYAHISDVMPTLLEAAQVAPAETVNGTSQAPISGTSFAYSFEDPSADTRKSVQYYEMYGNRAVWADGWKAVVPHRLRTWDFSLQPPMSDDEWQLYYLPDDPNELNDLAAAEPAKLEEMKARFDAEAVKYNVFPLTNTGGAQALMSQRVSKALRDRNGEFRYSGILDRIPESLAPPVSTHSYTATFAVDPTSGDNGTLFAVGGRFGGVGLYMRDGVPVFAQRYMDTRLQTLEASRAIKGPAVIGLKFDRTSPTTASVRMEIDGEEVASGDLSGILSVYVFSSNETFDIGRDNGTVVIDDVPSPFPFEGKIGETEFKVAVDE